MREGSGRLNRHTTLSLRKGQLNRHTRYRPRSHYRTKLTATQRSCHSEFAKRSALKRLTQPRSLILFTFSFPRIADLHTPSHSGTRAHHCAAISAAVVLADATTIPGTSHRTRHELQAHHGLVALLNLPLKFEYEGVNVNVFLCDFDGGLLVAQAGRKRRQSHHK